LKNNFADTKNLLKGVSLKISKFFWRNKLHLCLVILVSICLGTFLIYLNIQKQYDIEQQDYIAKVSNNNYQIKYLGSLDINNR